MAVVVGLLVVDLFVRGSQSLKDKRRAVRALSDRARARHNVSVAEVDYQDLLQRAQLAFASVASAEAPLQKLFDRLLAEAEDIVPGGVVEVAREVLG